MSIVEKLLFNKKIGEVMGNKHVFKSQPGLIKKLEYLKKRLEKQEKKLWIGKLIYLNKTMS